MSNWRWSRSCSAGGRRRTRAPPFKAPITVEDVLNSRMIAYPFRLLQCCLVTDGGGALILVSAERARDFPQKPVYLLGTGESVETPMVTSPDHSRETGKLGPQGLSRRFWTPASAGVTIVHCHAARPAPSLPRAISLLAASRRATPMAAASPTCIPACTACTQESVRQMRGSAPRRSPALGSRSAMVSAACSLRQARSSCRMSLGEKALWLAWQGFTSRPL